eukprot:563253-Prorocentrum_minimum.AAC.2
MAGRRGKRPGRETAAPRALERPSAAPPAREGGDPSPCIRFISIQFDCKLRNIARSGQKQ